MSKINSFKSATTCHWIKGGNETLPSLPTLKMSNERALISRSRACLGNEKSIVVDTLLKYQTKEFQPNTTRLLGHRSQLNMLLFSPLLAAHSMLLAMENTAKTLHTGQPAPEPEDFSLQMQVDISSLMMAFR